MKRYIQIVMLLLVVQTGVAQQQPVMSNFLLNDYFYNPAIAGSKNVHVANMSYRNQWSGFDEAPVTIIGNVNGSIRRDGLMGYGVTVVSDRTGLTQNTGFYVNYAHHFKLNDSIRLGIGVQPGYMQYRVRLYDARLADQGDEVLTGNVLSANAVDMHSGFHIYSNKFFVMGSVQHLLGKQIQFTYYNESLAKHYTMIGGVHLQKKKSKYVFTPSLMLKYVKPIPMQWTAMVKATYDNRCWAGLSYRSEDALGIVLGYTLKERLNVGYGFDYSLSGIQSYQNGSHEIVLSYVLTSNKPSLEDEDDKLNHSIMEKMKEKLKKKDKE